MSAPRKSRSKRLPISGRLGAPREWSPTADDWRRFEETYDLKRVERFDDKLRNAIHAAVTKYFYWEPYEPNANFADDFIEGLDKAAKIARQLTDALTALGPDIALTASHWDRYFPRQAAEETADNVPDEDDAAFLKRIFDEKPRKRRRDIKETVHAIRNVLDDTLVDVMRDDAPAWEEGNAWRQLILDLARAFEERAMKVKAAKDPYRPQSPFVRLVSALQATFDEKLRRHEADSGLSLAVWKVIKSKGKTRKTGANISRRARNQLPQRAIKRV